MRNLILVPVYYLIFAPISILVVLVRDPLRRRWSPDAEHYWHYRSPSPEVTRDGTR